MRTSARYFVIITAGLSILIVGCPKSDQPQADSTAPESKPAVSKAPAEASATPREPAPTVLLAQAQFTKDPATGKPKPGAARLVILRQVNDQWQQEVLEDPESNVFHKAIPFVDPHRPAAGTGILTIGANAAAAKIWHRGEDGWSGRTIWKTTFGGKQDRLRDFEVCDVTGDGKADISIATHDQGVIAVLEDTGDDWKPRELDRKENTFVHEIEVGDLDGNGLAEVYATPSEPNRFDGTPQPGWIMSYQFIPDGRESRVIAEFPRQHPKEILISDFNGDGRPTLLAAVEADLGRDGQKAPDTDHVTLREYHFENEEHIGRTVCHLTDKLTRFLNAGDVDGDGQVEIVASTHKAGLWLIRPAAGEWQTELIEKDSGGFEHATVLADLNGDGRDEIYVASDKQKQVRCYTWTDAGWSHDVVYDIQGSRISFGIAAGKF